MESGHHQITVLTIFDIKNRQRQWERRRLQSRYKGKISQLDKGVITRAHDPGAGGGGGQWCGTTHKQKEVI
jgi:hypothetical protein